jgi:hypothetical protein
MIDVALARIYSYPSGVQEPKQPEGIPDILCSHKEENPDFKRYIASRIALETLQKRRILSEGNALFYGIRISYTLDFIICVFQRLIYPRDCIIIQSIILTNNS